MTPRQNPVRILHVDDSPVDAEFVRLTLELAKDQLPASITYVQSRERFLRALERHTYDVILSDYRMPGFDGEEALSIALEKCPDVPFIMVTGEMGEDRAIETLQRGAADYVLKANMIRLVPAITRALAEAQRKRSLREAEEQLRMQAALIDLSPDAIIVRTLEGEIVFWSKGAQTLYGWSQEEAIGKSSHALLRTESAEPLADIALTLHRKGTWSGDLVHTTRNGRRLSVHSHWQWYERKSTGPLLMESNVDVTERRQAEEALRESEERVRRKLEQVLSPQGDLGVLDLADFIDAPGLQKLMDDFYAVARIPMSIVDAKGRVLVGVGWQQICTHFHRVHPETAKHCLESDTELSVGLAQGTYRLYKCKNNLWDIATPIIVGGQKVGNIFSGQFFYEDETVDHEFFRAQARQYGLDEAEYLAALDRVPRLSRSTVDRGMAFFLKLADMLSRLGHSNVRLARLLAERERLSTSLKEGQERLKRAQEIAHLGSWELDLPTNTLSWSDEVYRIFGLEPQQFGATYEAFLSHVHPEDRAAVDAAYAGSLREDRDTYEIEHRVVRQASGEVRYVHERCQHFRDASGRIVRSMGMVQDITERKEIDVQLRQLNDHLEARVRQRTAELQAANREMESFSYAVSHDLKAPLRVISGFAGLLARGTKGPLTREQQETLGFIQENALRMEELIKAFLEFFRLSHKEPRLTLIDTRRMVEELLEEQRQVLGDEAGARVKVEVADLPQVEADPVLLRQVFVNLLSNAFKFTRTAAEPRITVSAERQEGQITFCVSDNGVGFPKGQVGKLFTVFQRLHSLAEFEGTGIGLANVRKIIERHGGRVYAEGEEGKGASICFTLPAAPA